MRIRKGSPSEFVVAVLEKAVDAGVRFDDFATNTHLYAYYGWRELPKSGLSKALSRLKSHDLIEKVEDNTGEIIYRLTKEGNFLLVQNVEDKWDGKWRVVIFDIPEQKRIIRNLFRRNLKKWGFKPLQKSVWITKKDCFDRLQSYIKDLGFEKWVTVIESSKLGPTALK